MERLAKQVRQLDRQEGYSTMNSFYLTLPSNSNGQEFPNNASNSYKVRLPDPIRLDGEWEVGLSAVALPDAAPRLKSLGSLKTANFLRTRWRGSDRVIYAKDFTLAKFERVQPKDGVELCKMFITFCTNSRSHLDLKSAYFKNLEWEENGKKLYVDMKMEGEDLVLDNRKVSEKSGIEIRFDAGFAAAMHWIEYDANGTPLLGPNIQMELSKTEDLDRAGAIEDVQLSGTTTAAYWAVNNDMLELSIHANWRMVNIKQAFQDLIAYGSRSLFIYSNVGQSQVVGNKVTDLLREIPYETKGRGTQYVEPTHVQYKKVRNNMLDIIEVQVAETDGRLTVFREGVTTLTLHFRQLA